MSHFSIAGLQLELNNQDNLYLIQKEIEKVVVRFPWVNMIVLAELSTFGPSTANAQPMPGEIETFYCELAARHNVWIIPGSLFEKADDDIYNTAPVINPQGEVVSRYRKLFPFYPYEKGVKAGSDFVTFDVPDVGRFGICICYDQWFPEVVRSLACAGAEVIICPTMTNTVDRNAEVVMVQANAVQNQCYFVNINTAGSLGNGRSVIAGPDGSIMYEAVDGRDILAVELDLDHVRRVRERGIHNLGQVLKSFRDSEVQFDIYQGDNRKTDYLNSLGELSVPKKS